MKDRGRLQDLAFILPVTATLLMLPPILTLFDAGPTATGVPSLAIYIFTLWLVLVVLGARLTTLLGRRETPLPGMDVAGSSVAPAPERPLSTESVSE